MDLVAIKRMMDDKCAFCEKALALERICGSLRGKWGYLRVRTGEHGNIYEINQEAYKAFRAIGDYLDSQGKDSQQKPDIDEGLELRAEVKERLLKALAADARGEGRLIKLGELKSIIEKPKDEEVLRGILDEHSTITPRPGDFKDVIHIYAEEYPNVLAHILEHFQPIEGTTTKTVSTWTE